MSDQCEHTGTRGQCPSPKVDGSRYCSKHSDESDRIRGYRLSNPELRDQFEHHSRSNIYASAKEEIFLLRAMVNEKLNSIENRAEFLSSFTNLTPSIVSITKCIETLSKLERQNNIVLGKEALAWLQKEMVSILISELKDVENYERIVDSIAKRIAKAIAESRNQEK